tara:strand:+ start:129 stop:392 length:264 start_codon:yes stop_codon:yes gene_type:complete
LTNRLDVPAEETEFKSAEWHQLDIDLLKEALLYSKSQPDSWWQEYKKITRHENDLDVNPTSYVSGKIDDRWGSGFMPNGWRSVEHLQ